MGIVVAIFVALGIDIGFGAKAIPAVTGNPATAAIMFFFVSCMDVYANYKNR